MKKIILIALALLLLGVAAFFSFRKTTQKTIAILVYQDMTLLEMIGAYQTFPGLYRNNYRVKLVAKNKGIIKDNHLQSIEVVNDFEDITEADILYIPGGEHLENVLNDEATINWIKNIDAQTDYTMAVGGGALLLAKAGLLQGKQATTHWYHREQLENFGAKYANENYTLDGKYFTGMGASASIDMVLQLINMIAGEEQAKAMQLFIAYDPLPPIQSGMIQKADSTVVAIANALVNKIPSDTLIEQKTITMMLYDGFTLLDMTGPYQVFSELRPLGYEIKFVAAKKGDISSDMSIAYQASYRFDEAEKTDILFIPGGSSTTAVMADSTSIDWVVKMDKSSTYSTSVCTGSLVLAKAGLLENRSATSHWATGAFLEDYGVTYTSERYTVDGKYITGAGVSSGIDLSLKVVAEAIGEDYAKAIQLKIGYFPNPPFAGGSPESADQKTVDRLSKMFKSAKKRYAEVVDK